MSCSLFSTEDLQPGLYEPAALPITETWRHWRHGHDFILLGLSPLSKNQMGIRAVMSSPVAVLVYIKIGISTLPLSSILHPSSVKFQNHESRIESALCFPPPKKNGLGPWSARLAGFQKRYSQTGMGRVSVLCCSDMPVKNSEGSVDVPFRPSYSWTRT
jgi:hypothetical protein